MLLKTHFNAQNSLFDKEHFENLIIASNCKLERIKSGSQKTDFNLCLYQYQNKWIFVLDGCTSIISSNPVVITKLKKGDLHVISKNRQHRIERTNQKLKTICLSLDFKE